MAAHCEVTESGYTKNERGNHLPQLDTLENLVKKFDASMDWLLFNKGPLFYKEKKREENPPVQQKQPEEKFPGLEQVMPDVKELLDYMAKDPLLKYEILVFFYKYKKENS
jgi:transcriptional regulator with XRE-family HTH domain